MHTVTECQPDKTVRVDQAACNASGSHVLAYLTRPTIGDAVTAYWQRRSTCIVSIAC